MKTASSAKMQSTVIESVLKDHQVFVFGEFLALDAIKKNMSIVAQGKDPTDCPKHFHTLHLFAYGTWSDYAKAKTKYIELNPKMQKKLKMLTLV